MTFSDPTALSHQSRSRPGSERILDQLNSGAKKTHVKRRMRSIAQTWKETRFPSRFTSLNAEVPPSHSPPRRHRLFPRATRYPTRTARLQARAHQQIRFGMVMLLLPVPVPSSALPQVLNLSSMAPVSKFNLHLCTALARTRTLVSSTLAICSAKYVCFDISTLFSR